MDFEQIEIDKYFLSLAEEYEIEPAKLKMDDFGSGYSSLLALKDLTVDAVKLDMDFLKENAQEEWSWQIVQSIVAMTKKLGLRLTVEGVETKEQLKRFRAIILQKRWR